MASFEELLAQAYGNLVSAGERLTSGNLPPIPQAQIAEISPVLQQATDLTSQFAAGQPDFFGRGIGALDQAANAAATSQATVAGTMGAFDPESYKAFMNPFQDAVIDNYTKEMQRQFGLANQQRKADAISAGAFGGGREGVVQAEAQRGFQDQLGRGIAGLLSSGFATAQQQAQQAFENQLGRQQSAAQIQQRGGDLSRGIGQMFGDLGTRAPAANVDLAKGLSSLGVTQQQLQQDIFDRQQRNQMAQYMQPFQALEFQSGLVKGFPTLGAGFAPQQTNPLLAGIQALTR